MESHGARIDGHERRCIIVVLCLYLKLGDAQRMIEEYHETGWNVVSFERPYGRGVNLQMEYPMYPRWRRLINTYVRTGSCVVGLNCIVFLYVCIPRKRLINGKKLCWNIYGCRIEHRVGSWCN